MKRPNRTLSSGANIVLWTTVAMGAVAIVQQIARQNRHIDLRGKGILLTGGSRGLGLTLARQLHSAGARLVICGRDQDSLNRAEQQIVAGSGDASVYTLVCDVQDGESVKRAAQEAQRLLGSVDVLINNAGIIQVGPMETMIEADYDEALKTHFWGAYHFIQSVLPAMRSKQSGRIVNIASIGGKVSVPHLLPYSTSKFALVGYSEGLRAELMKEGIYVTTACPGLMRTGSPRNALFKGQNDKEYAWFTVGDSLPFVSIDAEEAAKEIIGALQYGDAEVLPSLPAKVVTVAQGIAPGAVADIMGLVNRFLPATGGIGSARKPGSLSESAITKSALTMLTRAAELRNNQR